MLNYMSHNQVPENKILTITNFYFRLQVTEVLLIIVIGLSTLIKYNNT